VAYGQGLAAARRVLADAREMPLRARLVLRVFSTEMLWRPLFTVARWLRATGLPALVAGGGPLSFSFGMLASTRPAPGPAAHLSRTSANDETRPTVALFAGCVMDTLFHHVHGAARRTLEANGYRVVEAGGQGCCGALHEHAGDHAGARALARANVAAFAGADFIAVDSAGCGALLKEYGELLAGSEASDFAQRVRDVTELLAERGPRPGGPLELDVAYDAPCHLQHAQHVHAAPLQVLGAITGLRLRELPGADRCCGSAGIYSMLEPGLSREVLASKLESIRSASPVPTVIATGNPGCLMQIGAGLRAAGIAARVAHPVELLDLAYQAAGVYDSPRPERH
jgi:glycolate oxidase iron-sulfur subunit